MEHVKIAAVRLTSRAEVVVVMSASAQEKLPIRYK